MVVRAVDDLRPGLLATPPGGWPATSSWAKNATHGANAARAEYNGLLSGLDLAGLSPTGSMNRGEVAQVLHNLLGTLNSGGTDHDRRLDHDRQPLHHHDRPARPRPPAQTPRPRPGRPPPRLSWPPAMPAGTAWAARSTARRRWTTGPRTASTCSPAAPTAPSGTTGTSRATPTAGKASARRCRPTPGPPRSPGTPACSTCSCAAPTTRCGTARSSSTGTPGRASVAR